MKGMSLKSLRTHYSLIPLFGFLACGVGLASFYVVRLATRNPDVSWNKRGDQEPWQEYKNKQYKFLNFHMDYNKPNPDRPDI